MDASKETLQDPTLRHVLESNPKVQTVSAQGSVVA